MAGRMDMQVQFLSGNLFLSGKFVINANTDYTQILK